MWHCMVMGSHFFSTLFQLNVAVSAPFPAFLQFFQPVLCIIFFRSHWLLSNITIVETMDTCERGMNPVTITIINLCKDYWPSQRGSNQPPPFFKSSTVMETLLRSYMRHLHMTVQIWINPFPNDKF